MTGSGPIAQESGPSLRRGETGGSTGGTPITVRVPAGETVTIILDEPTESDDEFELVSGQEKKSPGASETIAPGMKALRFQGVKPNQLYRLVHKRVKGGAPRVVFLDKRFQDLTKAGQGPLGAATYLPLSSDLPGAMDGFWVKNKPLDKDLVAPTMKLFDLKVLDPEL